MIVNKNLNFNIILYCTDGFHNYYDWSSGIKILEKKLGVAKGSNFFFISDFLTKKHKILLGVYQNILNLQFTKEFRLKIQQKITIQNQAKKNSF